MGTLSLLVESDVDDHFCSSTVRSHSANLSALMLCYIVTVLTPTDTRLMLASLALLLWHPRDLDAQRGGMLLQW